MRSFTKLFIAGISTLVAGALLAGPASATPITDLGTGEGTIVVDDKVFSDFTCSIVASAGNPLTCADIDVSGLAAGGNPGIQFQAAFVVIGAFPLEDVLLSYVVTVTDPNKQIVDVEMLFNGSVINDAITSVTETIFAGGTCAGASIGQIVVANPPPVLSASADLDAPQSQICVRKDILLAAFEIEAVGTISFIDQRFSQTTTEVPEPATLGLLGLGLLGLGVMSRRRKTA